MNRADRRRREKETRKPKPTGMPGLQDLLDQGVHYHTAGDFQKAEESYRSVLQADPDNPVALHLIGVIAHQVGKNDIAVEFISKALAHHPDYAEAHYNLGNALRALGKTEDAIASYERAVAILPDYAEAHNNLGIAYQETGRPDDAVSQYQAVVTLDSGNVDAHANLGNALKELGRLEDAVSSYRTALEIKPNYAAVLTNMGNALKDLGRLVEAEASYGDAVAANPEFAEAYYNLGIVKQHAGDLAGAAESYRAALTLNPDRAEVHNNLGIVLQDLGRMKEAETHYRAALAADPGYAPAYRHLMLIVKQADYNDDIHAMENLYARNDVSRDHKMNLAFGLGKAFDDLGEYDKAFGFFAEGNRLKRDTIDFSIDRRLGFFDALKNTFSDPFIRDRDGSGCPDTTPIFILGMPRSGTTLVEQILASHGQVHGAGELDALKAVVSTDLCRGDLAALPEAAQAAEPGVMKKLGEAYAQQLHALAPDSRFITDKMPGNFIYIGLIRLILPGAKIIHCRRDPVDTCLSVFKHHFSGDHPYAYDLRELGQYYNAYCGLMEHWDNVLPGFIHEVRYENVVRDHVAETESMLAFCGLPWDENCRNFHASDRPVRTASFEQVRQPIYKDSVQRWKAYENELAPLLEVLDL